MRARYLSSLFLALLLTSVGIMTSGVSAQGDSESAFSDVDLPAISIVLAGGAPELPDELEAGRYVVDVDNQLDASISVLFVGLPDGLSFEDAMAAAEAAGDDAPDWFYEATNPGGVVAGPGETGAAVINLVPGDFAVLAFAFDGEVDTGGPHQLTVTGDAAAIESIPEPNADVDAELLDFEFAFPETIPSGTSVWKITNSGEQPHEIAIVRGPDGVTVDQVTALNEAAMTGTPPPEDSPSEEDFEPIGNSATISTGQTTWIPFSLEPGTYVALCFVTDPETGMPHMMLGMTEVFTVE